MDDRTMATIARSQLRADAVRSLCILNKPLTNVAINVEMSRLRNAGEMVKRRPLQDLQLAVMP